MGGLTGMGSGAFAIVAGAIMKYAVSTTATGFNITTVGSILMIAGAIGVVVSALIFAVNRNPAIRNSSYDRKAVDSTGQSTEVHEDMHH
jgi:beta-lactamase regulating signal transducer with metallopeptidase domain